MKSPTRPLRILIVAGGTGGHLYPGIAVAQALWREPVPDGGHRPEIRFVVRRGDLGRAILQREGFEVIEISGQGLPRRINRTLVKFPAVFWSSCREARALLDEQKPDLVLGMGGYLAFSVLSVAAWRHIPTLIHEQNAVPGLANRFLARWVDSVAVSFPESEHYFPKAKVWISGLPIRLALRSGDSSRAREILGLKKEGTVFLAFGGSLGSHRLNQVFLEAWRILQARGRQFQVLQISGQRDFAEFEPLFKSAGIAGRLLDYCHDMPSAYSASNFVLSRAGASTIAELLSVERPGILIPYPYATNDHQWHNAQILVKQGQAECIRESALTSEWLVEHLTRFLDQKDQLAKPHGLLHGSELSPAVTIAKHILKQAGV